MHILSEVNMPQIPKIHNKYPRAYTKGINPILDDFLKDVSTRRSIDTLEMAVKGIRRFMRRRGEDLLEPYEITKEYLDRHANDIEEYLVRDGFLLWGRVPKSL